MRLKPPRRALFKALILLLAISIGVSGLTNRVWAPTNIVFIQTTAVNDSCSPTTCATGSFTDVTGDTILVFVVGVGVFNAWVYSDSQSNTYGQKVASITGNGAGVSTYIAAATVVTGGSDTVTVATGGASRIYAIWAEEYRNVAGYGVTATSQNDAISTSAVSYTSTLTFTSTAGSGSAIVETDGIRGTGSTVSITYNNAQTQRQFLNNGANACFTGSGCQADDYAVAATSFSISNSWSWSTGCGAPPSCFDSHSGLELLGSTTTPITTVTQCYGNCGTPAITLVNTNSTHGINWNQSLTFFYRFQPTINGFLNNVTVNLPKNYPSSFYAPFLGLYHAACPVGGTPFTSACPGSLLVGGQSTAFSKGRASFPGGPSIPVVTTFTDYYGVALTFQSSPEDVNDTNNAVPIYVTAGLLPGSIGVQGSGVFNPASKIGIWAWITGNVVGVVPPPLPTTSCTNNFAKLDCLLPALVNGFCNNVNAACQTGSSFLWIFILTAISVGALLYGTSQIAPGTNLRVVGFAEIGVLVFIGWLVTFAGLNLVPSFMTILVFFVVAWLLLGRLKGSGPI